MGAAAVAARACRLGSVTNRRCAGHGAGGVYWNRASGHACVPHVVFPLVPRRNSECWPLWPPGMALWGTCSFWSTGQDASQESGSLVRRLLQQVPARFLFDETGLKPYPIARQALAAVEACRQLVGRNTKGISAITVSVPSALGRVIDQPGWPSNRMQSIAGVQYQIALALLSPEQLMKFDRTPPFETKALRSLAATVRVRAAARLEDRYPETWPAHVVVVRSGERKIHARRYSTRRCAESSAVGRRIFEIGALPPRA